MKPELMASRLRSRDVRNRKVYPWRATYEAEIMPDGHLRIWRHNWGIPYPSWDVMQEIKNDMLGEDVTCVEIFPAQNDVVDERNYRHFWPMPKHLLPGWEAERGNPTGFRKRHPNWEME